MSLWICHPHLCRAIRPKQWDIASAGQCKQASAAAVDNCFRRSSTCSAFRCRSWSDSLMLESLWKLLRNRQGTRTSEKELSISSTFNISIPLECISTSWIIIDHFVHIYVCFSICHPHPCHTMRSPKQWDLASAGQCKQASAAAVDNCFWRSSTCSTFRCRSWSDSLMFESLWEVFRNHQGSRTSEKELSISGTTFSISTVFYSIPLECSNESWTNVRNIYVSLNLPSSSLSCNPPQTTTDIASAGQCKQASAAAVDNCFWRSSTCSAFLCRSWSDSLMFESVLELLRNHHKHGHQRKS